MVVQYSSTSQVFPYACRCSTDVVCIRWVTYDVFCKEIWMNKERRSCQTFPIHRSIQHYPRYGVGSRPAQKSWPT
eukprot:8620675-Pyramimonas_sp.AAC.1